ncbi:MAG: ABC transporter permease component [candidate division TM6 bacterium GW2011_GWF2_38_10]|nr:MAG: ABC transporter permease component [candidate division TM6 bacterium GW2011_GWF2_38_10]
MNFYQISISAFRSLNNHKVRSLLTTLGIIIGVVSIIAVMSIGEGAKARVNEAIEKLGSNFIIVLGASPKHLSQRSGVALTLKQGDLDAIRYECDDVEYISPGVMLPSKVVSETGNWQTTVGGVNHQYAKIRNWNIKRGEFFSEQDVLAGRRVIVLGVVTAKELFGTEDPIGKTVRIKRLPFKVIGVLDELGKSPDGRDQDDIAFAPIKTIQRKMMGTLNYTAFLLSVKTKERMTATANHIRAILRQNHNLIEADEDDFTIFTQDDISQASDSASQVLNLLLLIIASISLIVGGVGIMNIMLVSVTERTKEIGIRMALGATTKTILSQFIFEAVAICLAGGIVGALIGIGVSEAIGFALGWPIFISKSALVISLVSSVLIGLFFGYYPAYKASQLNPVEALLDT